MSISRGREGQSIEEILAEIMADLPGETPETDEDKDPLPWGQILD